MSEQQPRIPTMEEFVKAQIDYYHDNAVRAQAYLDNCQGNAKQLAIAENVFWVWVQKLYAEIETLYRIVDRLMNSDRYNVSISTATLGLPRQATAEEIEKRTKQFGELVNTLIKKKAEWDAEEKVKEKLK